MPAMEQKWFCELPKEMYFVLLKSSLYFFQVKYMKIPLK